jgi:hypothetical protein
LERRRRIESHYVQKCSSVVSAGERKWYYYCNRAGKYNPRGIGARQLKMQGTNKIGQQCTAHNKSHKKKRAGRIERAEKT